MAKNNNIMPTANRLIVLLAALVLLTGTGVIIAEDQEAADSSRFEAQDVGVDTIDVSKYPENMQEYYKVFQTKCSECHTLSRVINSDFALPDEWKRYIQRMRRKPGSKIKKDDAKVIWEFLVYDSEQRKADLIKAKTAAADSASEKE